MPDGTYGPKVYRKQGGDELVVASGGTITVESGGAFALPANTIPASDLTAKARRHMAVSQTFNLDNGAGTTIDDVMLRPSTAITIRVARIVYKDATSGTVAAGSITVGTTVAGAEIVAATNYENAKAVGTTTALALVSGAVAANTPVIVRHTGVAATQAGMAHVEIEYDVDD